VAPCDMICVSRLASVHRPSLYFYYVAILCTFLITGKHIGKLSNVARKLSGTLQLQREHFIHNYMYQATNFWEHNSQLSCEEDFP